jgi:hypothetical protein
MDKLVFTSRQIINDRLPILYVIYDNDGDWQFLSSHEKDESDGRVVSYEEIKTLDETLIDLSWLVEGMEARRWNLSSEWVISIY